MKLASHLKQSPYGVFYFRIVVPVSLRPLCGGQCEVKRSLNTKNPTTARRLAYMLWTHTAHRLGEAKRAMAGYDPKQFNPNDPSTWPSAATDARQWIAKIGEITIEADPSKPGDSEGALRALDILAKHRGARSVDSADLENIGRLGDYYTPPQTTAAPVDTTIRFSQARAIYLELVDKEPHLAVKTRGEMRSVFEHFLQWTKNPHDPQLSQIDRPMIERYMNHLLLEKPNVRTKQLGLAQSAVKKQLSFLNGLFKNRKSDFPKGHEIPTEGVTPYRKGTQKKIQKKNRYQPFDSGELQKIFAPETLGKLVKPHEFWCPLFGLYLGARLEEISQLRLSDISQQGELTVLTIRADESAKAKTRLKTESSERSVPLHRDLIALGFMDYLDDVRMVAPEGRVFPYLHFSSSGFGDVSSEGFARYLDSIGIIHTKKTFHSFRSTLNNHLKKKLFLPEEVCCLYVGQEVDSVNTRHYTDVMTARELDELIVSKIDFTEISQNIAALRYQKGRFAPILEREMARRHRHLKRRELQSERKQLLKARKQPLQ